MDQVQKGSSDMRRVKKHHSTFANRPHVVPNIAQTHTPTLIWPDRSIQQPGPTSVSRVFLEIPLLLLLEVKHIDLSTSVPSQCSDCCSVFLFVFRIHVLISSPRFLCVPSIQYFDCFFLNLLHLFKRLDHSTSVHHSDVQVPSIQCFDCLFLNLHLLLEVKHFDLSTSIPSQCSDCCSVFLFLLILRIHVLISAPRFLMCPIHSVFQLFLS